MLKIGVFDSGKGGESVLKVIKDEIPELQMVFIHDSKNVPYGHKTPGELLKLTVPKLRELEKQECDVIVVACNSVTTTIIKQIREIIKTPIVAIEPMVKPASEMTKSKVIAVCATPATLNSPRYKELLKLHAQHITVLEPDCSDWSYMIETNSEDFKSIEKRIINVCKQGADVIVLACTHYHWIEAEIKKIAKEFNATVIQPELAIVSQLKRVLAQL